MSSRWIALGGLAACTSAGQAEISDLDPPSGDADTDTDTETDLPPPTDSGEVRPPFLFDAAHVLVVPTADGLSLLTHTGAVARAWAWADLMGDCPGCTGEGASADGDGLLISWAGFGVNQGVGRIDATGALSFQVDGMAFPHDAVRDPFDQSILVPEAFANAVRWYTGDGSSGSAIRTLDENHPRWTQDLPNGAERLDHDGRTYLLLSNRGSGFPTEGRISFWDITDGETRFQWSYPPSGTLDTPHGPVFRFHDGQWVLLYAHSYGGPSGGAVGVAVTSDPTVLPAYVADLFPAPPVGPFDFLRGVELTDDDRLWLTDSGPEFAGLEPGRLIAADFPHLPPTGASGDVTDQVFVALTGVTVLNENLNNPFEGWLWEPTIPLY